MRSLPLSDKKFRRRFGVTEAESSGSGLQVALLTGGTDRHYALGLASALTSRGIILDFIGSDELDSPELQDGPQVNFLNLRGDQRPASFVKKALRVLTYYARLIRYAARAKPKVFHILWHNKAELFDRTVLILYYRLLGKRIAFTAHNVNAGRRDRNDSYLNWLSLKILYTLVDHIFVHTSKMKDELLAEFRVPDGKVSVIPYGINNKVPESELTTVEAKRQLGVSGSDKTILFFGHIAPYKGLEYLIAAVAEAAGRRRDYRLVIAGRPENGEKYWRGLQEAIASDGMRERVIENSEYIPDDKVEVYFKGADVLVLPYTHIYQSGVLFLGYCFGLPVIAADVGSLREDIIEGKTGFVFKPGDARDLARTIDKYFESDLYKGLEDRRHEIREYAYERHSWAKVGEMTKDVYARLLQE